MRQQRDETEIPEQVRGNERCEVQALAAGLEYGARQEIKRPPRRQRIGCAYDVRVRPNGLRDGRQDLRHRPLDCGGSPP